MSLQNVEKARLNMIEQQIRPWNVDNSTVLELLANVKREDFVPPAHKSLAFADFAIPLPGGQSMLAPRLQARLLQDAAVQPGNTVLEIGTGSGYFAALLAQRAQRVISLEINAELADMASANLQQAGITNVEVRQADGSLGAPAEAPFDVIVLGGSVAEVPQNLLDQLKVGGRLAAVVGESPFTCATFVTRTSATDFRTTQPWECGAPRLQNFAEKSTFTF